MSWNKSCVRLASSYNVSSSDYDLPWDCNWNDVRHGVEEELERARTEDSCMILVMVKFDMFGGREALVEVKALTKEMNVFNIPRKNEAPVEVRAVASKLW